MALLTGPLQSLGGAYTQHLNVDECMQSCFIYFAVNDSASTVRRKTPTPQTRQQINNSLNTFTGGMSIG